MKKLGTGVPQLIEAQLEENAQIMKDVDDLYRTTPRSEASILKRLRELLPVWVRANAALAAHDPGGGADHHQGGRPPSYHRPGRGAARRLHGLVETMKNEENDAGPDEGRPATLDRQTDSLNKRWYQLAKSHVRYEPRPWPPRWRGSRPRPARPRRT